MAYKKFKKKRIVTKQEQDFVDAELNVYKKFYKPFKGQFTFKLEGSKQEVLYKSRYNDEAELKKDAELTVEKMNSLDKSHKWILIGYELLGAPVDASSLSDDE